MLIRREKLRLYFIEKSIKILVNKIKFILSHLVYYLFYIKVYLSYMFCLK